tara:strand:+ start:2507 stop:3553 length:1047 start_codon:yes stop_codon:yes gene_type:complete
MGLFKKIFKGIKKVAKKIGRGIKKVVGKIGKAFGKLGVVGQIGMMFLMPHMMAGLGTFWGKFGQFASKLANSQGVAGQLFGKTLSAIHTAGSMVGKVYTGVTDTISSAFDVVTGKGTVADLGNSVKSIFSGPVDTLKASFTPAPTLDAKTIGDAAMKDIKDFKLPSIEETVNSFKAPTDLGTNIKSAFDSSSLLDKPLDLGTGIQTEVASNVAEQTVGEKIRGYASDQFSNIKTSIQDFDAGQKIVDSATSGFTQGIEQKGYEAVVGKRPTPDSNFTNINMASLMQPNAAQDIFDTIDLAVQNNIGNPYQVRAIQNYDYIQSGLIQDENAWFQNRQQAMNVMGMGGMQ